MDEHIFQIREILTSKPPCVETWKFLLDCIVLADQEEHDPLVLAHYVNAHTRSWSPLWTRITVDEVKALISGENPEKWRLSLLRSVRLHVSNLDDNTLMYIIDQPWFVGVEELDLCFNQVTAVGVSALSKHPHCANLQRLNLCHNPIGDEGIELMSHGNICNLTHLDVSFCGLTDACVDTLVSAPILRNLHRIDLSSNTLSDSHGVLRKRFSSKQLKL